MVASLFDIDTGIGLTQVLSGAVPLDEALVETDTAGLLVLPAGRIPHNPSEVVGSERMRDLIAELSSDHMVVIDAPPALPVTDAMIMAQRVDGLIVVTFMGKSRKEHLKKVLSFARGVNVRVFGIVLNGIPQGRAAGVYGYETYGYTSDDRRFRKNKRRHRNGGPRPQTAPRVDPDADPLPAFAPTSEPAHAGEPRPSDHSAEAPADGSAEVPDDIETSPPRPSRARSEG
jgi:capsular exopolysaccharide synthesis family protein